MEERKVLKAESGQSKGCEGPKLECWKEQSRLHGLECSRKQKG